MNELNDLIKILNDAGCHRPLLAYWIIGVIVTLLIVNRYVKLTNTTTLMVLISGAWGWPITMVLAGWNEGIRILTGNAIIKKREK